MRRPLLLLVLAACLTLPAGTASAQRGVAAQRDWSRTVVMTPEGGFRMGNPNARAKLIEYGSLTCPHCAEFAKDGIPPLVANYVKSGKASFEFRNFVLNGVDAVATLLARCAGPQRFFPLVESLYASQPQWVGKINDMTQTQRDQIAALPNDQQFGVVADVGGLFAHAARAGVTREKAKQCFADKAGRDRIDQMNEAASARGVRGTPTFILNGNAVQAHHWSELEPLIRGATG